MTEGKAYRLHYWSYYSTYCQDFDTLEEAEAAGEAMLETYVDALFDSWQDPEFISQEGKVIRWRNLKWQEPEEGDQAILDAEEWELVD